MLVQIQGKQAIMKFFQFLLLFLYNVTDMIKKLELRLRVVLVLFKIKLGTSKIIFLKAVPWCWKQPISTTAHLKTCFLFW